MPTIKVRGKTLHKKIKRKIQEKLTLVEKPAKLEKSSLCLTCCSDACIVMPVQSSTNRRHAMNALHLPGEVVIARFNPGRFPAGKARPAIFIADLPSGYLTSEITRSGWYSGAVDQPLWIPNPAALGLDGPGLLRATTSTARSRDIDVHLGWVDAAVVDRLSHVRGITELHLRRLRRVAAHHNPTIADAA